MPDNPHDQKVTNHYVLHFPPHEPRESDPHYKLFNAYHRKNSHTAVCYIGQRVGFDQCQDAAGTSMADQPGHPGLELHHKVLEFSLINAVLENARNRAALQVDFPFLKSDEEIEAWAETAPNFMWLCAKHHRGAGGVHHLAAADFEAELYVRDLVGPFDK